MEMVFKFKPGSRLNGDAQPVGEKLMELRKEHGRLSADIVLDDARPDGSVLHRFFEWDDATAAEQFRLEQARHVISCVIVHRTEDHGDVTPVRAFVKIRDEQVDSYEPIHSVLSDSALRSKVLRQCKAEIGTMREKLKAFEEFADVLGALDTVDKAVTTHIEQAVLG
jgi:hypothetical protein